MGVQSAEIYKGHSPIQHVLGRTPDDHDRLFQSEDQIPIRGELMADGGYRADGEDAGHGREGVRRGTGKVEA